jgi:type II secretory pathway pseudopilin PulG
VTDQHKPRRAFLLADLLVGLGIVAVLTVSVFVILDRASRIATKMSDSRNSARTAEAVLADLQADRPAGPSRDFKINVRAEPDGVAVPGHVWVRVTAAAHDQSAELVGLVPDRPQVHILLDAPATGPATREGQ